MPVPTMTVFLLIARLAGLRRDDVAVLVVVLELLDGDEVDLLAHAAVRARPVGVDVREGCASGPALVGVALLLVVDVLAVRADELAHAAAPSRVAPYLCAVRGWTLASETSPS